MAEQLMWKGRQVPWVTRWTAEASGAIGYGIGSDGVYYATETMYDRDKHGVLWMREAILRRGKGEPEFSQMSTRRQRKAMERGLCQVCGESTQAPYTWLMASEQLEMLENSGFTINPPICQPCVGIAKRSCPHLIHNGSKLLTVKSYHVIGVYGELAMPRENGEIFRSMVTMHWKHPALLFTLAKQLVIQFKEWEVVDE